MTHAPVILTKPLDPLGTMAICRGTVGVGAWAEAEAARLVRSGLWSSVEIAEVDRAGAPKIGGGFVALVGREWHGHLSVLGESEAEKARRNGHDARKPHQDDHRPLWHSSP